MAGSLGSDLSRGNCRANQVFFEYFENIFLLVSLPDSDLGSEKVVNCYQCPNLPVYQEFGLELTKPQITAT